MLKIIRGIIIKLIINVQIKILDTAALVLQILIKCIKIQKYVAHQK